MVDKVTENMSDVLRRAMGQENQGSTLSKSASSILDKVDPNELKKLNINIQEKAAAPQAAAPQAAAQPVAKPAVEENVTEAAKSVERIIRDTKAILADAKATDAQRQAAAAKLVEVLTGYHAEKAENSISHPKSSTVGAPASGAFVQADPTKVVQSVKPEVKTTVKLQ